MSKSSEYGQYCPIALAAEILCQKWTPLVIRELLAGSYRFNDLKRGVPLMSPTLLSTRLKELEDARILERVPAPSGKGYEYYLTESGEELRPLMEMYGVWSQRHLTRGYAADELDPSLLMWDMRRRVDCSAASDERRMLVRFEFSGIRRGQRRWWLLFERGQADLCLKDPGYDVDLYVNASLRALTDIWMGRVGIKEALKAETLELIGSPRAVRAFPKWFSLNRFANAGKLPMPTVMPG